MRISIYYGTESGNAETAAEDLAERLREEHDVEVTDLGDADVDDLRHADFVVVLCSTYGEGELPATAIPFAEALDERQTDLNGVRYAVFGLGDTFYEDTYSHGADILDEKLSALGAERVGEIGRHDASSWAPVGEAAVAWLDTIGEQVAPARLAS